MLGLLDLRERGERLEPSRFESDPIVIETVRGILQRVHAEGDPAVLELAQQFDGADLSFGTDSVPAVDRIVGPGNAYVTEAKQPGCRDRRDRRPGGAERAGDRRRRARAHALRAGARPRPGRRGRERHRPRTRVASNHVLPTAGTARFGSGLRAADFVTVRSVVEMTAAATDRLAQETSVIARSAGLVGHAGAMDARKARA